MLIIRVGIATDRSLNGGGTTNQGTSWAAGAVSDRSRRRQDGSYAMKDLKVEITQVVEDDADYSTSGTELRSTAPVALTRADLRPEPVDLEIGEEEDESSKGSFGLQGSSKPGGAV